MIYALALVLLILLTPDYSSPFSPELIVTLSVIYGLLVIYFFNQHKRVTKNWVRFDVFFIIGYTIVHFQLPFYGALGLEPAYAAADIWPNKSIVNYATWMSTVAITLWMWGYQWILFRRMNVKKKEIFRRFNVNLYKFDIFLLISLIVFLSIVGSDFFKGIYDGGRSWGEGANYAYLVLRLALYLRIVYFLSSFSKGAHIKEIFNKLFTNKLFVAVLGIYTFLFLVSGDRGPVMHVTLILAGSYAFFIRPVSFKAIVILSSAAAIIFTIISLGRTRNADDLQDTNIFARGYENFQHSRDDINITAELAGSVRVQYRALEYVPYRYPYLNGLPLLLSIAGTVPFGASTVIKTFNIPEMYTSSSSFLNIIVKGEGYTSGDGSEILSDIYINFGVYGTFVIMFLFGMASSHIYNKANAGSFIYFLVLIILLYYGLYMSRAMLFTPLKDIISIIFLDYLFRKLLK